MKSISKHIAGGLAMVLGSLLFVQAILLSAEGRDVSAALHIGGAGILALLALLINVYLESKG